MGAIASLILACAVCGAAERNLPENGNEVAFAGRKRATLQLRAANFETLGRELRVTELRAQPGFAMAVLPTTLVGVDVPVLHRSLESSTRAGRERLERSVSSLGDVEVRASHTAWRSGIGSSAQRFVVGAGVKLPTAPLELAPSGEEVHPDLQPGCGSVTPVVEATYAWSSTLWSAWTTASLVFPVSVREGAHPGDSLRASATMQLQPTRAFATRLGVHGRYDTSGEAYGQVVKDSGGASLHIAPEIVISPVTDLVIGVGASFPAVQAMRGYRATTPVLLASIGIDF